MKPDGLFYLGKEYSLNNRKITDNIFSYQADDLTTHAVVFGMTGSGKTGLCIDLLEEAIAEDTPIIIIDPKGDVSNLALMFPELSANDFKKWVSPQEAKKEGKSIDEYSVDIAQKWKNGLESWDIDKERIEFIKNKMDLRIFTPGSSAGIPVSIVEGFNKPEMDFEEDEEGMVEKIKNSVSALLSLLDIESDPLKSKPHILISNIIEHFWRMGRSLSIEELILNIQKPPMKKLGVFDINRLIDDKERVELAFKINNIIASPSFRFWSSGVPLSAQQLYKKRDGKVPVNIFYIAHLPDPERMFLVSLLLNEIVYWIRTQPGSSDLKYIFYMDEIFGYLPPYPLNPPSKNPLMILMKQARAFGLGVLLVTQNPKDIDYKALTNTGTWFLGKLQAEGDRERVMEGLKGVLDSTGETLEMAEIRKMLTSLDKRVFLVKNVHEKGVKIFHTRWAISYLTGPIAREQIKELTKEKGGFPGEVDYQKEEKSPADFDKRKMKSTEDPDSGLLSFAPQPEVPVESLFEVAAKSAEKVYSPHFYLKGEVIFDDHSLGIYIRKKYIVSIPVSSTPDWKNAEIKESLIEYSDTPLSEVKGYKPFGATINYSSIRKVQSSFKDYLYSNKSLNLFINREMNIVSEVDESEKTFLQRCRDIVEKTIDKKIEKIKENYDRRIDRIGDKIAREKLKIQSLESEHKSKRTEEIVSIGETLLGVLLGSKSRRGFSTAARRRRMTSSAASKIKMRKMKLSQLEEDLLNLQEELEEQITDIEDSYYEQADNIEDFKIRLEKDDIIVSSQNILWKLM